MSRTGTGAPAGWRGRFNLLPGWRGRFNLLPGWRGRFEHPAAWRDAALALLLGAAQTVAFTHTAAWPLPLLCLAWLAHAAGRATPRRAALLGGLFGTAWLGVGVWWLFVSLHRYGGLPAPLAALAVLLLAAVLSLYQAAALAAFARWRRGHWAWDAALFAALWLLAELARTLLFTGFPWLATGYSQIDGPLAALAPWLGVAGMGAASAALAAMLAAAVARRDWRPLVAALLPLAVLAGVGPGQHTVAAGSFTASLLQTNVAQDEKFAFERLPAALQAVAAQLLAAQADLVVTPETAVPLLPDQLEEVMPGYWEGLRTHFAAGRRAALVGVPLGDAATGYTNSVLGLGGAAPYRYDKTHLVPFGEFIPTGFRWFTEMMHIPLGDFNRGAKVQASFTMGAQRLAPNICYEDLFGEELALRFAQGDAQAPTVFVNLSNIAWFGATSAIAQHLNISRLRALEFQRPMLRATNTGATAVIDHHGRVSAQLAPFTAGVLTAPVQGRSGLTPYAVWVSRTGLWPWVALALAVVLGAVRSARREAAPG